MGSESIAHEGEGQIGYWLRGHEGERNNCFSKIQLVDKKNISSQNILRLLKLDFNPFLPTKDYKYGRRLSRLVGYNIEPTSSTTNQNAALIIDHLLDFTNKIYCNSNLRILDLYSPLCRSTSSDIACPIIFCLWIIPDKASRPSSCSANKNGKAFVLF